MIDIYKSKTLSSRNYEEYKLQTPNIKVCILIIIYSYKFYLFMNFVMCLRLHALGSSLMAADKPPLLCCINCWYTASVL